MHSGAPYIFIIIILRKYVNRFYYFFALLPIKNRLDKSMAREYNKNNHAATPMQTILALTHSSRICLVCTYRRGFFSAAQKGGLFS